MESNDFKKKSWVFPFVQSKYSITSIPVRFPKLCPKHDTSFRKIFLLSLFQRLERNRTSGCDGKLWNRTLRRLTLWKRSWIEPVDSTHSVECCSSFQERRGWFHRKWCPSSGGKSRPIREKRRQLLQRKVLPDIMFKSSRKAFHSWPQRQGNKIPIRGDYTSTEDDGRVSGLSIQLVWYIISDMYACNCIIRGRPFIA